MRKRTQAREIALQALYQHDLCSKVAGAAPGIAEDLEPFLENATDEPEVREYARWLLGGSLSRREELDRRIVATAKNWRLNRIAPVDRCVLRLALFEMMESKEVPPKVAINEAINLAKRYSTEQSGAFVNGILDKLYREILAEAETREDVRKAEASGTGTGNGS
jgi:transcription antitermination factor NusB